MNKHEKNKILLLFAHPAEQRSRANMELVKNIKQFEGVTIRDLYELYPDFLIDVAYEQELLLEHDVIILQHPFYWYSCPSITKEWMDLVLEHGFAYGDGGNALAGKKMMTAITTGGSEDTYAKDGVHAHDLRKFLLPFEQTAVFCGMEYLPPFVVHNTQSGLSREEIAIYRELYEKLIVSLRDGEIDYNKLKDMHYLNDYFLDEYNSWSV